MKSIGFVFCFGLLFGTSFSQHTHSPTEDMRFAQYLIENELYNEAVYILKNQLLQKEKGGPALTDSIHYYTGWSYFNLKELDSSCVYFSKVAGGPFYHKASFYCMFNKAYLQKTSDAKILLDSIRIGNDSSLAKLSNLEFAGIALLERDYRKYEECSKKFYYNFFSLADEEKKSAGHYTQLIKVKKKSPFLAGAMSALVPGSGKFYAGNKGQGIAALMTIGVLGISAAESYYRLGPKSPHFITFGSLFTIFYVGNIWGSVVSVRLAREHQLREIDDQILFDMHIPLRRIFN